MLPRRPTRDIELLAHDQDNDPGAVHTHPIDGAQLSESIHLIARHRGVNLMGLSQVPGDFGTTGQPQWATWRRRQALEHRVPERGSRLRMHG
ncbi:MAG: hypothetical protein ACRDN0_16055 [Trebonia sp.]